MERKIVSGVILTLLLMSTLTLAFNIQPVETSENSYTVITGADPYSTGYPSQRKLAITSDGRLHVVYHRKDANGILQIFHAESADGGKTWTEEQVTNAIRDQNFPALAVDSKDNLHLVWEDGTHGKPGTVPYTYYKKKTTSWQAAELVASYADIPSIAVDSNDDVHIVYGTYVYTPGYYGGGEGIRWRVRTSTGWQPEESISENKYWVHHPAITIDGNNDVHVVWSHAPTQYYDTHYRKRTTAGWGTEMEINTQKDNEGGVYPSIAVDSNNHVHIVWHHLSGGYSYIKYRKYTTSWQPVEDIEGPITYAQRYTSIAIDSNDQIHVAWSGQHHGSPTYYQIRYRSFTTSWQSIQDLTSSTSNNQTYPSLMWALHPTVNGVKTNLPQDGYSFIWTDGTTIKYSTALPPTPPLVHDIAITSVTVSPYTVKVGELVTVSVTVENQGDFAETFMVTILYDSLEINTAIVADLSPSNTTALTFTWDTTGIAEGMYTIKVICTVVEGETDTADNTFIDGVVTVTRIELIEWTFAIITDLHIGRGYPDYGGEGRDDSEILFENDGGFTIGARGQNYYLTERLNNTVKWLNENREEKNIKFLVVLGDIADSSEFSEMYMAKKILDDLEIPYFPVLGNHDVWSNGEAGGDSFFEIIFNNEFFNQQCGKLGVEWKNGRMSTEDSYLQNYAFSYNGINFVFLDFVNRRAIIPASRATPVLHSSTVQWLNDSLSEGKPTVIFSHHPMIAKEYPRIEEFNSMIEKYKPVLGALLSLITGFLYSDTFDDSAIKSIEAIIKDAENNFGTKVLANFAGHVHGWSQNGELRVFMDANADYKKDTVTYRIEVSLPLIKRSFDLDCIGHVPADMPVVTTEAVMVASNELTPKGVIRIVKIRGNEISDYSLVEGEFRALNPSFEVDVGWLRFGKTPVEFETYAFTRRFTDEYPLAYMMAFGDNQVSEPKSATGEEVQFTHEYDKGGYYNVTLLVIGWTSEGREKITEKITREIYVDPPVDFGIFGLSPIDIAVTDSDGRTISKQLNEIPGATYIEVDLNEDGNLDDLILIPDPLDGNYVVTLIGTAVGTYSVTTVLVTPQQTITQTYVGETVEGAIYIYNITITDEVMTAKPDPVAELEQLKTFLNGLPSSVFDEKVMSASKMKNVLSSKIDEIIVKVQVGNYTQAIDKLRYDIRAKMDGDSTARDWIIDQGTQFKLCLVIDHIIESIKILQENN